jgi:hypothetical protein
MHSTLMFSYLPAVAAQHSHVGGCDCQQPSFSHCLQRTVKEVRWRAVRVQIDRIIRLQQQ